jgi:glycosyltransferase involved in cell wall biosynthesis
MEKITCICVTRNRYPELMRCVNAFLKQTYPNKELVIVDDSVRYAPPSLRNVLTKHQSTIIYKRLNRVTTIGTKRNKAISLASGMYVAIWDDDDIHFSTRLERQLSHLLRNEADATMTAHNTLYHFADHGRTLQRIPRSVHDAWWYKGYMCPSMLFKKSLWEQHKYLPVNKHEDYHFIKRIEKRPCNAKIHLHQSLKTAPFFGYTIHKRNISGAHAFIAPSSSS